MLRAIKVRLYPNKTQEQTLNKVGVRNTEFTLVDYPTMDDRLSNEVLKSSDRLKQEIKSMKILHS